MDDKTIIGTHTISDVSELKMIANTLAQQLRAGDIVLLQGDLGSGKTTFTQFIGKALGVQDKITSPTYAIVAEYEVANNTGIKKFIHMDLYRSNMDTNYVQEIVHTAAEQKAVVVIEWSEKLEAKLSSRCWNISIKVDSDKRIMNIERL